MKKLLLYSFLLGALTFQSACKQDSTINRTSSNNQSIEISEGTMMSAQVNPQGDLLVFDLLGQLWTMPISGGEANPITDPYGNARQASWSPDGEQLTFMAYWSGNWQVYVVNNDGTGLKPITEGPYDHREPVWSPNGKSILFSSDRTGNYDVWRYDLDNAELTNLTDSPFNQFAPAWYNDSEAFTYIDNNPDNPGIIHQKADEKTNLYSSEAFLSGLSWNPTGSHLIFYEEGNLKQVIQQEQDRRIQDLGLAASDILEFPVSWMDEERFVFTADGKILQGDLQGTKPTPIPFNLKITIDRPSFVSKKYDFNGAKDLKIKGIFMPRLSPDANAVAMVLLKDLYLQQENGELQQITNDPFVEMAPCWSPDQKQIAFVSDRGGSFGLWVHNLSTGKQEKLSDLGASVGGLDWSSDGTKIAYTVSYGPRLGRLFYYDLIANKSVSVGRPVASSIGAPSWSPDGEVLAVSTLQAYSSRFREGINGVIYFSIEENKSWRLGKLPHFSIGVRTYNGPAWSPDGKYLAAISASKLWLIPVNEEGQLNGELQLLSEELADAPSWSADSKNILFLATNQLKKINIETGQTTTIEINQTRERTIQEKKILVKAGMLFNGLEETPKEKMDILIIGNRIESIMASNPENEALADEIIDASEQFVMPGLIDAHAHQGSWEGEQLDRSWLAWGVTSTRDPASDPYDALNRREALEAGRTVGPRIFFTGSPFDGSRIYYGGANALQDRSQIQLELDRAKELDYDMIKTYVRLSDSLQQAIVDAAHAIGIPVSSHELYPAVAYGVDGVEHILGTSRRGYSAKMTRNQKTYSDVIQLISKSGMSFCPTTGIYVSYNCMLAKDTSILQDQRLRQMMAPFAQQAARSGIRQVLENPSEWEEKLAGALEMVKNIQDAGGLVVAGTDSPIIPYGFALYMELLAYAEAGLSNFEVLQTATLNGAKILRLQEELGTISEGKLADLLILNKNPLENIRNLKEIDRVMANGRVYTIDDLIKIPGT